MMAMSGSGGFILNAIKMYVLQPSTFLFWNLSLVSFDDPTASYALLHRRQKLLQKRSVLISEEAISTMSQSHSDSDVDAPTM